MSTIHIKFNIEYYTRWGQQVCICGSIPELGNGDENTIELSTTEQSSITILLEKEAQLLAASGANGAC
jgi:hypothetical protein